MKCSNCGKENVDGVRFCAECGTALPAQSQPAQGQPAQSQSAQSQPVQPQYVQQPPQYMQPQGNGMQNIPPEYKPISMWGYFGYELLFAIPCVGFILLLVFAFGGTSNQNVKNFARSYFCLLIVMAVLIAIIAIAGGLGAASSLPRYY